MIINNSIYVHSVFSFSCKLVCHFFSFDEYGVSPVEAFIKICIISEQVAREEWSIDPKVKISVVDFGTVFS